MGSGSGGVGQPGHCGVLALLEGRDGGIALQGHADLVEPANRFTAVFGPYRGPAFEVGDLFVWGFTAMLLSSLFELAGLALPWDVARERPLPDRVMSPWMRGTQE